jgi:uncharacterized membrane protein YidH (DUF202 family)
MTSGPDIADRGAGPDMAGRDPGLARERTALAWTRTAISVAALGAAILKTNLAAGGLVLPMSALVWAIGRLPRYERSQPGDGRRLLLVTFTVTLVSCAALVLTLRAG